MGSKSKMFLVVVLVLAGLAMVSCSKSSPSSADAQATATTVPTATSTPQQTVQSHFYTFETDTNGWVNGNSTHSMAEFVLSVAHNTNAAYCDAGSAGSLQLNVDFSSALNFYAIACLHFPSEINFEYHTITARVYIPAGMVTAVHPLTMSLYVRPSTWTTSFIGGTQVNVISSGWQTLQMIMYTYPYSDTYQHISEIGVQFMKDTSCTIAYAGQIYLDSVAW
jgi:hypothetical protein